jgi:hypothetical protein
VLEIKSGSEKFSDYLNESAKLTDDELAIIADYKSLVSGDYSPAEALKEIKDSYDKESLTKNVMIALNNLTSGYKQLSDYLNESAAFNVTDFKPGAEVKVGNKIGTIVSNLPNDNDEISIDFDGKVKWIDIDKVMLNESAKISKGSIVAVKNMSVKPSIPQEVIAKGKVEDMSTYKDTKELHKMFDKDSAPDDDAITVKIDGNWFVETDVTFFANESDSTDVTDTGNETVIVSDSDKPLPVQLATEFVNLTDKEITFENWIQSKALDNDAIDNKTIVETKTALAKLQTEQVLNESAQLTAKFVNESTNMLNESAEIALIKQHIPASHSYMVSQLNESALFVLEQQAKMYSVNESNIYDFIESRDWQAIANSSINESAAINSINNNISATNFSNKLMQSLRAGK